MEKIKIELDLTDLEKAHTLLKNISALTNNTLPCVVTSEGVRHYFKKINDALEVKNDSGNASENLKDKFINEKLLKIEYYLDLLIRNNEPAYGLSIQKTIEHIRNKLN